MCYNSCMDTKYDWMTLGPCPYEEDCARMDDYSAMTKEVRRYANLLDSRFLNIPESCYFGVKSELHEFGTYKEAAIYYEMDNEEAAQFALFVESNCPATWDDDAKLDWKTSPVPAGWDVID